MSSVVKRPHYISGASDASVASRGPKFVYYEAAAKDDGLGWSVGDERIDPMYTMQRRNAEIDTKSKESFFKRLKQGSSGITGGGMLGSLRSGAGASVLSPPSSDSSFQAPRATPESDDSAKEKRNPEARKEKKHKSKGKDKSKDKSKSKESKHKSDKKSKHSDKGKHKD
ncbi:hypothetical protein GQ54DRAFT_333806 [Martensiomyces pterosporus]|nr:hypothetical protein GQ54DRAFT_333806 [Martensiomyces pterosporus]